nr:MAG TPA: Nuclease [Caudoviricetes sp.]
MRNVRIDNEAGAQETLFQWAEYQASKYPELKLLYHIPNGGKRDKVTAINLKRQGVKAGVPDICLPVARGGYFGLYIELKVGSNKPTKLQNEWLCNLNKQGYLATVCYGWQQAAEILVAYLECTN